jgi:hypothetical protein
MGLRVADLFHRAAAVWRARLRRGAAAVPLATLLSGCAMLGPALQGGPHPLANVQSYGLAFVGHPQADTPARLMPGPAGDLVVYASGLGLSALWIPGWLIGAPLWMPSLIAAEEAACRAAVNAHPDRLPALRQAMAQWPVLADLNARLALRLTGRAPARLALLEPGPASPPPPAAPDAAADPVPQLLARARTLGVEVVAVFDVSRIELQAEGPAPCATKLFVAGRIRALRAADGELLELRPMQPDNCRRNAGVPLERVLTDDTALALLKEAAVDCAARELIGWADLPWWTY